jgi:hypothetical protein
MTIDQTILADTAEATQAQVKQLLRDMIDVEERGTDRQVPTTGFSINWSAVGTRPVRVLILDPAGTLATGTVNLPTTSPAPSDGEIYTLASTQTVTALTLGSGAHSLSGAITTIAANGFASYVYNATNDTYYRVG